MFRCGDKKANWYLNRKLADIVCNDPLTIKLNFKPNGLGNHEKGYGLGEMQNKCVNCGTLERLTKHHVVPICYRRHFPIKIKSHNFHDVLPMCDKCHDKYERKADDLKRFLAKKYKAPINGIISDDSGLIKYVKIAKSLVNETKIPFKRKIILRNKLKEKFEIKRLTFKKIKRISEISIQENKTTHSEIVMKKLTNISKFIEMWRKHFIKNNECKFLPKKWNIKYNG